MVRVEMRQAKGSLSEASPSHDTPIRMLPGIGIHGIAYNDWLNAILLQSPRGLEHGFQSRLK